MLVSPVEASSPNLRKQIEAGTSTPGRVEDFLSQQKTAEVKLLILL
jgi:hypothetical protein